MKKREELAFTTGESLPIELKLKMNARSVKKNDHEAYNHIEWKQRQKKNTSKWNSFSFPSFNTIQKTNRFGNAKLSIEFDLGYYF